MNICVIHAVREASKLTSSIFELIILFLRT